MKLKLFLGFFCFFNVAFGIEEDGFPFPHDPISLESPLKTKKSDVQEKKFNDWLKKRSQKANAGFKHYISKYFPKVFSVREQLFSKMTPEGIAQGLKEIVDMLADKPWLYLEQLFKQLVKILTPEEKKIWKQAGYDFDALPKKFDNKSTKKWLQNGGGFWEFIVDQLCFYNEFIELAMVDSATNTVFLKEFNADADHWNRVFDFKSFQPKTDKNSEILKDYWNKKGVQIFYEFYALYFDYLAKLFLESILQKDLYQAIDLYCFQLKIIMGKLTGSDYEAARQEDMKNYKELLEILKHKIRMENGGQMALRGYLEEISDFLCADA